MQKLTTLHYDTATVRANDGKCDALGRFWVSSIDCRSGLALVQQHADDALTGNGLGWSVDGRTLYWSDTPNHTIHAWSYDLQTNLLTQHRHFVEFAPKPPDWTWEDTRYQRSPGWCCGRCRGQLLRRYV